MKIFSETEEQILTEYKALRDELGWTIKVIMNFMLATVTATSVTIVVSFHSNNPYPSLAGILFAICSLLYIKSRLNGLEKIGTFIALRIESRLKGLTYETSLAKAKNIQKVDQINKLFTVIIYISLIISGLGTFDYLYFISKAFNIIIFCLINALILIILLFCSIFYSQNIKSKYMKKWKDYFENNNSEKHKKKSK